MQTAIMKKERTELLRIFKSARRAGVFLLLLVTGTLLSIGQAYGSMETDQLKELKRADAERAKMRRDKENTLIQQHPELEKILRGPTGPGILYAKRQERLRYYTAEVAEAMVDTIRVLAIRVQFEIDDDSCTTGNGQFTLHGNGEKIYGPDGSHNLCYDPPHTRTYFEYSLEGLKNYMLDDSYGKVVLEYTVVPGGESASYTLPHKMVYYGDPTNYVEGLYSLCQDGIEMADADPANIVFSNYDVFILFHAGSMWQTDYFWNSQCDLITATLSGLGVEVNNGTETVNNMVVFPETAFQDFPCSGFTPAGLAHEVVHVLGAAELSLGIPDLYDVSGKTMGVGGWDVMGTGGWNMSGLVPPHTGAWTASQLGFIEPVLIDKDTTGLRVKMRASSDNSIPKAYRIPLNSHEYFLVENRNAFANADSSKTDPDSNGVRVWRTDGESIYVLVKIDDYDFSLPPDFGQGGLAVWHIEDDIAMNDSARLMDTVNAGPIKGVDMEEADGIQDFERYVWQVSDFNAAFFGTPYDVFFKENNAAFTPLSSPSTGSNSKGSSHISITNISRSDSVMTFDVSFDWDLAGFPVEVNYSGSNYKFDINSPTVADADGDGKPEILVASTANRIFGARCDGSPFFNKGRYVFSIMPWYADTLYSSTAIGDFDTLTPGLEVVHGTDDGNIRIWYSRDADSNGYADPYPQYIATNSWVRCAPVMADLNGDKQDEVVIGAGNKKLYAFGSSDSGIVMLDGFPVDLGRWTMSTPVVVDSVIYALSGDGRLFAISRHGDTLWTKLDDNLAYTTGSPVAADFDADGLVEIVVPRGDGRVACVDETGSVRWSVTLPDTNFFSTPAIADIDEDGYLDVVFTAGSKIYGLNKNGASIPYFPVDTKSPVGLQSSPVIGDINGDSHLDILVGSPNDLLMGYDRFGNALAGFPASAGDTVYSTPALCDLDNDGKIEIVLCSDDGFIHAWNTDGDMSTAVWPMMHRDARHSGYYAGFTVNPLQYADLMPREGFYAYPNPATEGKVWVRYDLREKVTSVEIKVFNVAGDLVREISGSAKQGASDNYLSLEGLASGVYMLRVTATGAGSEVVRTKKFALVR
jgi:M6 family metalloprotease-like protein